jgi:SulP family sulfate permease
MGRVPIMDATGIQALADLIEDCRKRNTRVVLVELRDNVRQKLERAGVVEAVGAGSLFGTLDECLDALAVAGAPA